VRGRCLTDWQQSLGKLISTITKTQVKVSKSLATTMELLLYSMGQFGLRMFLFETAPDRLVQVGDVTSGLCQGWIRFVQIAATRKGWLYYSAH
jgi:hypothetical protein